MAGTQTVSTARVIVVINANTFATAAAANWSLVYNVKPIYELDRVTPRELAPGAYIVNFQISGIKVLAQDFQAMGIAPAPGINYVVPYISLAIIDRLNNVPLLNINAAMISELSFNGAAKDYVNFNLNGVGFAGLTNADSVDPNNNGIPNQAL